MVNYGGIGGSGGSGGKKHFFFLLPLLSQQSQAGGVKIGDVVVNSIMSSVVSDDGSVIGSNVEVVKIGDVVVDSIMASVVSENGSGSTGRSVFGFGVTHADSTVLAIITKIIAVQMIMKFSTFIFKISFSNLFL